MTNEHAEIDDLIKRLEFECDGGSLNSEAASMIDYLRVRLIECGAMPPRIAGAEQPLGVMTVANGERK